MPMPGVVSQGFMLKTLGQVCSDHKPPLTGLLSQSQAFLADLKDEKQPLLTLLMKYGIAKTAPEKAHLSQDWFNAATGWWPQATGSPTPHPTTARARASTATRTSSSPPCASFRPAR